MAIASFLAGESISAGQAIYVASNGLIFKASSFTQDQASVAGLAIDSGDFGDLVRVNIDSVSSQLTGLSPGQTQYLSVITSGQLVDYATWQSEYESVGFDPYQTVVGRAVSTSGVSVEIRRPIYVRSSSDVMLLETGSSGVYLAALLFEDNSTISLESALN